MPGLSDKRKILRMEPRSKISSDLASKILTVGPDYRNHRGGIGAIIESYSRNFEIFNFVSTYKEGSFLFRQIIFLKGLAKMFSKLARDKKIKIVHIHGASYGSFYRKFLILMIGKHFFKKKIIYHIHGGGFHSFYKNSNFITKRLIRHFFKRSDIIICISGFWKEYFENIKYIKKIIVLPNIIDHPVQNPGKENHSEIIFLFLGLVDEFKGIFDLIEVIAKNKNKYNKRIKLLIGGNGKTQKLKEFIRENEIENIVEFLGWVKGDSKQRILYKADVYILPSYIEGSPVSILEAMSYGMPIISTYVGGIPELVENEKNGLLIEPGNLEQIEKALDFFVMHPENIKSYGDYSARLVQKHLPESVVNELENIYQSILPSN